MLQTAARRQLNQDPLGQAVDLPLTARLFPLGFPLDVTTNSPEVLDSARETWSRYPKMFSAEPIRLRLVLDAEGSPAPPAAPVCHGQQHLHTMVSDAANFAIGDYTRQFAFCRLTPGALADPTFFRFHYLEGMVYSMLAQSHLTMIHAACVSIGGRGVLLAGESGSGKSTLAFACAARGWDYVSDDASSLVRGEHSRRVIGRPFSIRFRPSAVELFPELRSRPSGRHMNGKPTIEIATADLPGLRTAFQTRAEYVVFLNRRSPAPRGLVPIPKAEAIDRLLSGLPLFDPAVRKDQEAPCLELVEGGTFELRYRDLDGAVRLLEALVEGRTRA